jgi:hypothetical protein
VIRKQRITEITKVLISSTKKICPYYLLFFGESLILAGCETKLLGCNGAKASRLIKRLRVYGLIKKVADFYKYYLTKLDKETIIMSQKIKELVIVPAFSY